MTNPTNHPEQLELLRFRWADFAPLTKLEGSGGVIRSCVEDFVVEEVPLYAPSGSGSYVYVLVEKTNLTTRDVVLRLARAGVRERDIGVAGLKDKQAVTRQWLSVPRRYERVLAEVEGEGVRVLEVTRHTNKLGMGHLAGNRFSVRVRHVPAGGFERARLIVGHLLRDGVPNYFGPQRFGRFGRNAIDGYRTSQGEDVPGGHRLKRFFVSALQSLVFNHLLSERIEQGLFTSVVTGDWAKKHDTGGVFQVEDAALETLRVGRKEISATFPLFGKKVRFSHADAAEREQRTLDKLGLRWFDFTMLRGDRRFSRVFIQDVSVEPVHDLNPNDNTNAEDYVLSFTLPRSAFATSVLREILKVNVDEPAQQPELV